MKTKKELTKAEGYVKKLLHRRLAWTREVEDSDYQMMFPTTEIQRAYEEGYKEGVKDGERNSCR